MNNKEEIKNEDRKLNDHIIRIWEKSIDVQMHFNDLIMRNRTIVLSFITAIFGAAAYVLKDNKLLHVPLCNKNIHISALIVLLGICFLISYAIIDIFYYLRLLIGAVKFTESLDIKYREFGLTTKINKEIMHRRAQKILIIHYAILIFAAFFISFLIIKGL